MRAEAIVEGRHHKNALKIPAGFGNIVQALPLIRLLQNHGHRLGLGLRRFRKEFAHVVFTGGQRIYGDRVQPALWATLEVPPEVTPGVAAVKNYQRSAPPAATHKQAAAIAAHERQGKNSSQPTARNNNPGIGIACF